MFKLRYKFLVNYFFNYFEGKIFFENLAFKIIAGFKNSKNF